MQQVKAGRYKRDEVPVELTWKLEDLFPDEQAWESELNQIEQDLSTVTKFKGRLGESADTLLSCILAYEALLERFVRAGTYANLRSSEDGSNPVNQANSSKVASLNAKLDASLSFISSELLELEESLIEQYILDNSELETYRKFLFDLIATKPYKLSPETEEALAALGEVHSAPYRIYGLGKSSDMQFNSIETGNGEELPVSFALYEDVYEFSPDTAVRRKAYDSFVSTLKQYKNTFAGTFAAEVKKQVALSQIRGYESVTHKLLHPQQISLDMYHNQLDVIQKELAPHMRRFAKLKQRELGLDKMMFCDLKAPLDPDFNPKTTFEEASEVILKALEVMGPEYSAAMKKALTERWVDLADNVGKSTGAFCSSPYGSHPYILITWGDTMRSAFVLAHELGHAGHFYLANSHQTLFNTRPSMYFIEAPSTMNERLLAQHLLSTTTDTRMRRWVITQQLATYYHNFVTHLLEGELQRRIFNLAEKGTPITANLLSDQKTDILTFFWGDAVEIDEGAGLTWMRQPHYYMGLYPYTYSAGLTVSTAVSEMIQKEGQPAVERWLDVLKLGGTKKPEELIRQAGLDMTSPEPIKKAVAYVGSLIDELEKSYE
ncbi:oligoendopeptidase F [Pullulanibacillus sp. KACC 23026]|uniref:oligoendopeptidase F n=1 Tax=Pullulanibacillus sp. KACC 23026 TaxID=3028315 RepID=UPI0023B15869|nr:oligoendopeptidase F [Pullulanibacillus sp. KACC 23026]WEG12515.1 oligoendopeptidase F [Pullulanibacillus sp. KACC 23026]